MDALEMLKLLNEDEKLFGKLSNKVSTSKTFTNEDIRKFIIKAEKAELIDKNRKIPLRKAIIIIYEEYLQKEDAKRGDYEYDFICNKASVRYPLTQRDKTRFPTLEIAHPEYPCRAYEDDRKRKYYYTKALEEILVNACWLIEDKEAEVSLRLIYSDVKLC